MKAITVHQPWASALALGMKRYETRPKRTNHRGPIAIHAGRQFHTESMGDLSGLPWAEYMNLPIARRWSPPTAQDFPQGAILAVGELTDCIEMDESFIASLGPLERSLGHWEPGRFAYQIDNIQPLPEPVLIGGKQGLWNWDEGSDAVE